MESPFTEMGETVGGTDFGGMEGNQEFGFRPAKLEVFIRKPRRDLGKGSSVYRFSSKV